MTELSQASPAFKTMTENDRKNHSPGGSEPYRIPFFRGVEYAISFETPDESKLLPIPRVAFTGRSNSGKSTLISALCDHNNLARSSRSAGKTRLLNYFLVPETRDGAEKPLYLIDMPGYGYAKLSHSEREKLYRIIERFLRDSKSLQLLVLVLDARRKLNEEEREIMRNCAAESTPFLLARTRWDTLNTDEKKKARQTWKKEGILEICYPVSSTRKKGLEAILERIRQAALNVSSDTSMEDSPEPQLP